MPTVTVSPKSQITIPREIRDSMKIKPGQEIQQFNYGDQIVLIPIKPMKEMKDFLKGVDTDVPRDADRM